jgi:hypothetical protein
MGNYSWIVAKRKPTEKDNFGLGTCWLVNEKLEDDFSKGIYIQTNKDKKLPKWEYFERK